ncbi:LytTR family transcriptional regulator DNA-binding domain-containing protein [Muricauda sp. SCSIO 64092]|uniref:LytTR family DNA-binding domain-containing protein n=1 Tax=Allomuricauda sp. SCSIO 64092 TaxID=2908842 RepID=UPI001FF1FE4B|nr:LytTR family DNA-binding domain-containing protein [Muricauda sp. SCSIO 64092]UOY05900.1 LytTR family transcriptional regulator DNA-binding domain-containing protein [Muricauda sp. SCSIO 64092]
MRLSFLRYKKKDVSGAQELLFKWPYIGLITISITTLNFLITYNLRNTTVQYLSFYVIDLVATYLIIEFYAFGIHVLNKRAPLGDNFVKRVTYQFTAHTLSVVIFSILINELLDAIFFQGERLSLSFDFYTQDTVVALVFILLFHCIYLGLYLLSAKSVFLEGEPKKIKVFQGMAHKLVGFNDVICVYTQLGNTYVVDSNYNSFVSEKTLGEFEELVSQRFFRANRQFLVTMAIIDSYKSAGNGKVEVFLKANGIGDLNKSIYVSRSKASSFRSWLKKG